MGLSHMIGKRQTFILIGSRSDGNFITFLVCSFREVAEGAPFLFSFSPERTIVSVLRSQEVGGHGLEIHHVHLHLKS